jgi:Protein of unknown function (DUF5131)
VTLSSRPIWERWNWRLFPDLPRTWADAPARVALIEALQGGTGNGPDVQAAASMFDAANRGAVFVLAESAPYLRIMERASVDHRVTWPMGVLPALPVERQADLAPDAVGALTSVKAAHHALVITPREAVVLGEEALRGRFVGCPDKTQDEETDPCHGCPGWTGKGGDYCGAIRGPHVDLVIVRGPTGPDAWPMHPAWVRSIKKQCDKAGVAFALMSWGEWKPTYSTAFWQDGGRRTEEERGVAMLSDGRIILEDEPADVIRARDAAAGYHVHSPVVVRDQGAVDCMHAAWRRAEKSSRPVAPPYDEHAWFYHVGVEHSGRALWARRADGSLVGSGPTEHLELPEDL